MTKIFEDVKPGDLITADLFNKMADEIEKLNDRVAAIERTATGTIAGVVKDAETSSPVIGARLYAISGNVTYSSAPTDNLGNYSITNLLPGIYRVWAESEDYARSKVETVTVTSAATSTVNFILTSAVSMVEVPDVQGMPLSQALATINQAGLKTGFILDTHLNVIDPANPASSSLLIINQSLSPGDPVPAGTVINLFLGVHAEVAIPPIVLDIKPNKAKVGDNVEIVGVGLGAQKGKVIFAGKEATEITSWAGDSIQATVPTGAVSGDVQVITADGVKSNTFSFTVDIPDCTASCTSSCTTSCTIGCTSGCTTGCTFSCTGGKIVACDHCEISSTTGGCAFTKIFEGGCGLTKVVGGSCGLMKVAGGCGFVIIGGGLGTGGCGPASLMTGVVNPGDIYVNPGTVLTKGDTVKVIDKGNPVEGTIKEADIVIEEGGKAIIPSGTDNVKVTTPTGEVTGPAISSTGIGVDPAATVVTIKDADGKEYGGTIVSAKGRYEAGTGITLNSGIAATVKVGNKLVTGTITDKTVIGTGSLDIGRGMMQKLGP